MNHLPGPAQQPYAPQAGQHVVDDNARKFLADLESAYEAQRAQQPTAIRINDPDIPSWQDGSRIGTTPPIAHQPGGRAPMSQAAVDYSARILSTSVASVLFSAAGSGLLIASNHANPTTLGLMIAAPAVLTVPILALKSLMKSAKQVAEAAPPTINNHYSGPVHQDHRAVHVHTKSNGVIAYTRNQLPELPPANH